MKRRIYKDELYPFYAYSTYEPQGSDMSDVVEIEDYELESYLKTMAEFDLMQSIIEKKYKALQNND